MTPKEMSGTVGHISHRPFRDCINPDSYGMICVHCNQCGRFTKRCLICKKEGNPPFVGWIRIELIDSFRELICPQCKKRISPTHIVKEDGWSHKVIWKRKKDFISELLEKAE